MSNVVYLCARYARHEEMGGYVTDRLREIGYEVRAEWTTGKHHDTDSAECALIDIAEIRGADVVIAFTEPPNTSIAGRGRGGRHVEFGYAFALGKRCVVVGYRENVFYHHPDVEFCATFEELIDHLTPDAPELHSNTPY